MKLVAKFDPGSRRTARVLEAYGYLVENGELIDVQHLIDVNENHTQGVSVCRNTVGDLLINVVTTKDTDLSKYLGTDDQSIFTIGGDPVRESPFPQRSDLRHFIDVLRRPDNTTELVKTNGVGHYPGEAVILTPTAYRTTEGKLQHAVIIKIGRSEEVICQPEAAEKSITRYIEVEF